MSVAAEPTQLDVSKPAAAGLRRPGIYLAALATLTAVAFLLRFSQLHESILGDEFGTYQDIYRHSFSAVLRTVHTGGENSPPLYFLLAWAAGKLGDLTVWIRLPSLVLGTATVPVVYLIGREVMGRTGGLIAAAVMAVAPFAVYYGVEARPYATMTFFVALSTFAMLRAIPTRSPWWWLLYAGSAAAAAYSHYTSIFLLGAQAAWSLWACRDRLRPALLSNLLIVLLYLPWLSHLRGKSLAVIGGLYPLTPSRVLGDLLRPIPGHPAASLRAIPTILGLVAVGACVLAGLVAAGRRAWRGRRRAHAWRPQSELLLLVALTAATPVGLLLYSLTVTDLWLPRGLSASMPAAALLLGALLAGLPRPLTILTTSIVLVTLLLGTLRSFGATYTRGPYRAIAAYLDSVARPEDPIIVGTYAGAGPMSAQFRKPHLVQRPLSAPMWRLTPAGGDAYLVVDDLLLRLGLARLDAPPGFVLVARRHYAGFAPTDVVTYRRRAATR